MTLWIAIAIMTGLTVWAMLMPLARRMDFAESEDVAVYQAQLGEIDRDEANGVMAADDARAARLEISRRLLAAHDRQQNHQNVQRNFKRQRLVYLGLALVAMPAMALSLYSFWGAPQQPDQPLQARLAQPLDQLSPQELVQRVERVLVDDPDNIQALSVLAPIYMRTAQWYKAVTTLKTLGALESGSAQHQAELGEALMMQANGTVTDEALQAFDKALSLEAGMPLAVYYQAIAKVQKGQHAEASAMLHDLLRKAPPEAPWRDQVKQQLALGAMEGMPVQEPFSQEEAKKIMEASPEEREAFIAGMVARLAGQVAQEPDNLATRLRAIRALVMSGKNQDAASLVVEGNRRFAGQAEPLRRLNDLAVGLDIPVEAQQ